MIGLAAVNVGTPSVLASVKGEHVWSGIRKQPVGPDTTLWLSEVNLSGDGQADLSVHGGVDKAVYAYPSEHLAAWNEGVGRGSRTGAVRREPQHDRRARERRAPR